MNESDVPVTELWCRSGEAVFELSGIHGNAPIVLVIRGSTLVNRNSVGRMKS